MKKIHLHLSKAILIILIFSCNSVIVDDVSNEQLRVDVSQTNFVTGELLIKFKTGGEKGARISEDILGLIDAHLVEEIKTEAMVVANARKGVEPGMLILVKTNIGTELAIERLKGIPEVEYAEPNWIYQHYAISNDTYFKNATLWGMYGSITSPANQFGSGAATAWASEKIGSENVFIGIIDEGYMFTHDDIAANAGKNPGEIAGNRKDDDGNGYVDDVFGWDFLGNDNTVFDGIADDHGTHVAGTIGGVGGNNIGVAGVVWKVKMIGAKFLGSTGGTTANAIKSVDYFTNLKNKGVNIVATNNSWGGGGFSQGLKDAIDRANAADILFIAAAGNSGSNNDATLAYPSGYTSSNIIAVASITSVGSLSTFSQFGANTVDIGAPGSGIWSTVPLAEGKGKNAKLVSGYASYNGTSMATPHVTGAVALYASLNPTATGAEIKQAILSAATPTPSLLGKVLTNGRLNVSGF